MASAFSYAFDSSFGNADTVGPVESWLDEVIERVADNVHAEPTDAWLISAVDAAVEYVITYTNREGVGLPGDQLTINGLVGFATRIYTDAFAPNGAQVAVADASFTPIFNPEHLYKHWRHYFMRLNLAWGVA